MSSAQIINKLGPSDTYIEDYRGHAIYRLGKGAEYYRSTINLDALYGTLSECKAAIDRWWNSDTPAAPLVIPPVIHTGPSPASLEAIAHECREMFILAENAEVLGLPYVQRWVEKHAHAILLALGERGDA